MAVLRTACFCKCLLAKTIEALELRRIRQPRVPGAEQSRHRRTRLRRLLEGGDWMVTTS
jgi:hypothetical protein